MIDSNSVNEEELEITPSPTETIEEPENQDNEVINQGGTEIIDLGEEQEIENSGLVISIAYDNTRDMRIKLAITKIQEFKAISDIDDEAASNLLQWQNYYIALKKESDSVLAFDIPIPNS